jgi:uroporphyrinogen III methyltransferase / synthase
MNEPLVAGPGGGARSGRPGRVYLVGAGPGDPGLLTLRAARLLRRADVVVHDALIGPGVLERIGTRAIRIDVGKRHRGRSTPQDRINEILVEAAANYRVVVRLKGGDPFVFGRGGEEILALQEAGVSFEVVPGITAAVGATAYAGIPLTHRDFASSVTFVTGHEDACRGEGRVDWRALGASDATLAIYMGVARLGSIADCLMTGGRDPGTPVAIVEWGTHARQRTVTAPLSEIARVAEERAVQAPALVVVGDVVSLRERIAWFDRRPLRGARVVVARSRAQRSLLAARFRRAGAEVHEYPLIRAVPARRTEALDQSFAGLPATDWLLFASVAAVEHFWSLLNATGRDTRALGGLRVAALGVATTRALRKRGVQPDLALRSFDPDTVAGEMRALGLRPGQRVVVPGDGQPSAVAAGIVRSGAVVDPLPVFRAEIDPAAMQAAERAADFAVLPSSSAARAFAEGLAGDRFTGRVVAIGPRTAAAAEACGLEVTTVAEAISFRGAVAAVRDLLRSDAAGGPSIPATAAASPSRGSAPGEQATP